MRQHQDERIFVVHGHFFQPDAAFYQTGQAVLYGGQAFEGVAFDGGVTDGAVEFKVDPAFQVEINVKADLAGLRRFLAGHDIAQRFLPDFNMHDLFADQGGQFFIHFIVNFGVEINLRKFRHGLGILLCYCGQFRSDNDHPGRDGHGLLKILAAGAKVAKLDRQALINKGIWPFHQVKMQVRAR